MVEFNALAPFHDLAYYSAHFMDLQVWEPYIQHVCKLNGMHVISTRPAGRPGTFPTFIMGYQSGDSGTKNLVVKFFGPLFEGWLSCKKELEIGQWLAGRPLPIPSPQILASGQLEREWWYIAYEFIDGVSVGEARAQLTMEDWSTVAREVGKTMKTFHTASLSADHAVMSSIRTATPAYPTFLQQQRDQCLAHHTAWNDLPPHMLSQLMDFVLPVERLIDITQPAHLIHADLTADHLLGRVEDGMWHSLSIIDWGDARWGNILYELAPLYLDMFRQDKNLLQACLEEYNLPGFFRREFARKALSVALLHEFPLPPWVREMHEHVASLDDLAEDLYGLD